MITIKFGTQGFEQMFGILNIQYQTDSEGNPIDIVIRAFDERMLEDIGCQFGSYGYNCRHLDPVDAMFDGILDRDAAAIHNNKGCYEALYARLDPFEVISQFGKVSIY